MEKLELNNLQTGVTVNNAIPRAAVSLVQSEVGFTLLASTVWSGGDRENLLPAGLVCENNRFHDFGRWTYTYQAGAHVAGVGVQIRKNLFFSSYHVRIRRVCHNCEGLNTWQ